MLPFHVTIAHQLALSLRSKGPARSASRDGSALNVGHDGSALSPSSNFQPRSHSRGFSEDEVPFRFSNCYPRISPLASFSPLVTRHSSLPLNPFPTSLTRNPRVPPPAEALAKASLPSNTSAIAGPSAAAASFAEADLSAVAAPSAEATPSAATALLPEADLSAVAALFAAKAETPIIFYIYANTGGIYPLSQPVTTSKSFTLRATGHESPVTSHGPRNTGHEPQIKPHCHRSPATFPFCLLDTSPPRYFSLFHHMVPAAYCHPPRQTALYPYAPADPGAHSCGPPRQQGAAHAHDRPTGT
jgi:hypothetical protein